MNETTEKVYLGDSVYARFDGFNIILTTENGNLVSSNVIVLDPSVCDALQSYRDRVLQEAEAKP